MLNTSPHEPPGRPPISSASSRTADPGPRQDQYVAQQVEALDAVAAERGGPQEPLAVPRGLGELVVGEAPAGLEHGDGIALLDQSQRGDATAEARPDDHDVVPHALC
jgi:hypothetical protein